MSISLLLVWIAFAVAVGMYAHNYRDRDQAGWTILALVISPLLAWAFVAAMKPPAPTLELEDQGAGRKQFGIFIVGVFLAMVAVAYLSQLLS